MGFSVKYLKNWRVEESPIDVSFVGPKDQNGLYPTVVVTSDLLPMKMSSEEYAKRSIENANMFYTCHIIREYDMDINGTDAYVIVANSEADVLNLTDMTWTSRQVYITDNLTGYVIIGPAEESKLDDYYYEPMLRSFKVIPKTVGIEFENVVITPHKTEPGNAVTIKFDAVNKASAEKTEIIGFTCLIYNNRGFSSIVRKGSEGITLAPGETKHIEFVYEPLDTGKHIICIGDQRKQIDVAEKNPMFSLFKAAFVIALLVIYNIKKKGRSVTTDSTR